MAKRSKRKGKVTSPDKQSPPPEVTIHHTPELEQHHKIEQRGKYVRNVTQTAIDYYRAHGRVTLRQHEAATIWHQDFTWAGMAPLSRPSTNPTPVSSLTATASSPTEGQALARERWRLARDSITGGPIAQSMAENVVCFGYLLKDLDYKYYNNVNQMMPPFLQALDDLADHYGLFGRRVDYRLD